MAKLFSIGLDVSLKETWTYAIDESRKVVKEGKMAPSSRR